MLPELKKYGNHIFFKAFADAAFMDIFHSDKERDKFISDLYVSTGLYFNILTQKQTEENLRKIFKNTGNVSAVINIGSMYIEMLVHTSKKYEMYNLKLSLNDISNFLAKRSIPEIWDEVQIEAIKQFIKDKIGNDLKKIKAKRVVIIKNELDFMNEMGYP